MNRLALQAARRERIRRMYAEGLTTSVMAQRLGVSPMTVANDIKAMGLPPVGPERLCVVFSTRTDDARRRRRLGR